MLSIITLVTRILIISKTKNKRCILKGHFHLLNNNASEVR